MPGLTLAVLICLPMLIGLGVWQYQRWQWKTGVLAEIEAAVSAPPVSGLDDMMRLRGPIDFRRIDFSGEAVGETFHLYRPDGNIQWLPVRVVESAGRRALVAFEPIDDADKVTAPAPEMDGPRAGYIRRIRPRGAVAARIRADSNPDTNRWFAVNPDGAWLAGAELYIDASDGAARAADLPVVMPDVPNNHVSYMLTWWSFAVILLVIYGLLHWRAGRLSFARLSGGRGA